MKDETKKAIASASDALEAISGKMYTASELAALALEEVSMCSPKWARLKRFLTQ